MTRDAQDIDSERLSERVAVPATRDEIGMLAVTLNAMLDRIESEVQRQRRFVADASHELRTPLTSIRANLELLERARDVPEAERASMLTVARAQLDHLADGGAAVLLVGELVAHEALGLAEAEPDHVHHGLCRVPVPGGILVAPRLVERPPTEVVGDLGTEPSDHGPVLEDEAQVPHVGVVRRDLLGWDHRQQTRLGGLETDLSTQGGLLRDHGDVLVRFRRPLPHGLSSCTCLAPAAAGEHQPRRPPPVGHPLRGTGVTVQPPLVGVAVAGVESAGPSAGALPLEVAELPGEVPALRWGHDPDLGGQRSSVLDLGVPGTGSTRGVGGRGRPQQGDE